ncbi:ATP-binding protein, partial [Rhodopirellula sallentina]|uniref:ATP-binding protein n=1 Tax=Rhodopirellula sallentina TaxID=1263869 RepID=UPI001F35FFB6
MRQIVTNLVGNAIKFTSTGEIFVDVSLRSRSNNSVIVDFAVHDTGVGIPKGRQADIFNMFSQADLATTRQFGGTGLGLSISRQLTELMNGQISVESEEGKGSTFRFHAEFGLANSQTSLSFPGPVKNQTVLVVDDNESNRSVLTELLVSWQLDVVLAESGKQATAVLEEAAKSDEPIRLVIIDEVLPEMDGWDLCDTMRSHPNPRISSAKILMMRATMDSGPRSVMRQSDVTGCLPKPIKHSSLHEGIIRALAPPHLQPPPPVSATTNRVDGAELNVLLVEDGLVNQKVATTMLQRRGHNVHVVCNG